MAKYIGFNCTSFYRYKVWGTRAYVVKPLNVDAKKHTTIAKHAGVQSHYLLIAAKIDDYDPMRFKAETLIGDGSWGGEKVCIIGASIGKNGVISSNSVMPPDFCVAVGNPAKVIKQYNHSSSWCESV